MFNNVALDVVIGLVFIFLLYSLLTSILMEFVAKILSLRARMLLKAISKILDDSDFIKKSDQKNIFSKDVFDGRPFTALFYNHPNIKNLGKSAFNKKPSDISPEMFSDTYIQILRGDGYVGQQNQIELIKKNLHIDEVGLEGTITQPIYYNEEYSPYKVNFKTEAVSNRKFLEIHPQTLYQLKQLIYNSHSDIDWFKKALIDWYNEMMDRANEWYIKQTRFLLFVIGIAIAIAFNVDTIAIEKKLSTDKGARDKMVEMAQSFQKNNINGQIDTSKLSEAYKSVKGQVDSANSTLALGNSFPLSDTAIVGWLLTGLAMSLGAPFWFDLLGKIMSIRQGGNNKTSTKNLNAKSSSNPVEEPIG